MPNPPIPPPPPPLATASTAGTADAPALTKFPLHTPANASSPLITCSSSTGPLPNQTLLNLRTVLVASRFAATSRIQLKDDNRKLANERHQAEQRTLEEQTRINKESERKRKRDEDDKRERDRLEQLEREQLERRQQEERVAQKAAAAEREQHQQQQLAAERDEQAQQKLAREQAEADVASQAKQQQPQKAQKQAPPPPVDQDVASLETSFQKDASSPEPEEDSLQPKPPRHHDKKKRKRDAVLDSDESGAESTPAPEQPLLQKIRKLETSQNATPSSASTPAATPAPPTPSARDSPLPFASQLPATNSTLTRLHHQIPQLNPIEKRLREERFTKHSIPIKPPAPGSATAFYVPTYPIVPVKPEVVPPVPTAKRQADVEGDFSNAKPGQQIAHSTFVNWTESYLRPFGEDDLAFLAAKPEDVLPYIIPPLGKSYQQRWEEEDFDPTMSRRTPQQQQQLLLHQQQQNLARHAGYNALEPAPLPRLKPCHLSEEAMATENIFLGPLSERLMSALALEEGAKLLYRGADELDSLGLVGMETLNGATIVGSQQPTQAPDQDEHEVDADGEEDDEQQQQQQPQQRTKVDGPKELQPPKKIEMDAVDLEERIKRELRFIGLLPEEEVDWSSREDDEISTSLRACQRSLQLQVELNEHRKAILMSIVKDRMAYQEYETARDAQERVIEAGWHKRQRTDSKNKKKKGSNRDRDRSRPTAADDDPSKVPVSPVLMEAVEKRNALVESFRPFFEEEGGKNRWWGIPETSVFDGTLEQIDEEALDERQQEQG
ncbi:histone acetyltransferase NGG1 [Sporobolomyces koalae]|uniref:histone acetyltransferase NGG1 n=1 Tax=Sporobolomyces koalae TaxID=500713 RepID=UPI003170DA0A